MVERIERHEYLFLEIEEYLSENPHLVEPFGQENKAKLADLASFSLTFLEVAKSDAEKGGESDVSPMLSKRSADSKLAEVRELFQVEKDAFDAAAIGRDQKEACQTLIDGINERVADLEISPCQLSNYDTCLSATSKFLSEDAVILGDGGRT